MSTPPPNAWATGRLQEQIQASALQKAQPSKGQEKDCAPSGVSGPAANKASAPQKAQPSKGQEKDRTASGTSGRASNKENVVPTAEAKGKLTVARTFAPAAPVPTLLEDGRKISGLDEVGPVGHGEALSIRLQGGKLSIKGSHTSLAAISDNSFDTNPFRDNGTPRAQAKDHSSGVLVSDDSMPRADSKDQSSSGPASPKSHSSDDALRGFLATEKFPDFHQLPEKPLLGTIKPATLAKFNAYLARGGKEDEAYAGKWSQAEDGAGAGKKIQAEEGPQRAPKTEHSQRFLSIREYLPTIILVQFSYGQNYADKSHSALISLTIPPCPPGPNSPYKPITCAQLIEEIERKANFPGPRGRLANKLRTVHIVWQTPAEGPDYISPTPIVETIPRSVAGRVGTVAMNHQQYSDPRHYYYGGTPIPDYPLDEQGRPQMGPGLTQRGGVGYYDDHGNYKVTPYEQQPQMYPANFYHGETTSPSKWEKQGWYKSNAPTGKWADLTMLQDILLWDMLKEIATRSPTPNLTVVFEVEDMYDR